MCVNVPRVDRGMKTSIVHCMLYQVKKVLTPVVGWVEADTPRVYIVGALSKGPGGSWWWRETLPGTPTSP